MKNIISKILVSLLAFTVIFAVGNTVVSFENHNFVVFAEEVAEETAPDETEENLEDVKNATNKAIDALIAEYDIKFRPDELRILKEIAEKGKKAVNDVKVSETLTNEHAVKAVEDILKHTSVELAEKAKTLKTEAQYEGEISFNGKSVLKSLKYMGIGMVCIFAVIGVIVLTVVILNKTTAPKKEKESHEESEN